MQEKLLWNLKDGNLLIPFVKKLILGMTLIRRWECKIAGLSYGFVTSLLSMFFTVEFGRWLRLRGITGRGTSDHRGARYTQRCPEG
jgi:hypothetical protein